MSDTHFEPRLLQSFLDGELTAAENRGVVRHLLGGCEGCRERTLALLDSVLGPQIGLVPPRVVEPEAEVSEEQKASIERILLRIRERQADLAQEREKAPWLFQQLEPHPLGRQIVLVTNCERFWKWGLCELLLNKCWESRFDDAANTLAYARLAVAVVDRCDASFYGPDLVQDLKARAWAYLGNAHKINSSYREAEDAFRTAQLLLEQGTGDPVERARILELKAAFRGAQGRYRDALLLLEQVVAVYRLAGDPHQLGTALVHKGMVCGYLGDLEEAIRLNRQGVDLLEPEADLGRFLAARHNLVYLLHENGQLEEALTCLRETCPLYAQLGDRLSLLRLRWLEGKIALTLGKTNLAEAALLEARNGFLAQGIGFDAAEVSLELAALYARDGRTREMRQLAGQMLPVFQSQDMHQFATAALMMFQDAAESDDVTVEFIREILAYLEQARHQPDLPFRPATRRLF